MTISTNGIYLRCRIMDENLNYLTTPVEVSSLNLQRNGINTATVKTVFDYNTNLPVLRTVIRNTEKVGNDFILGENFKESYVYVIEASNSRNFSSAIVVFIGKAENVRMKILRQYGLIDQSNQKFERICLCEIDLVGLENELAKSKLFTYRCFNINSNDVSVIAGKPLFSQNCLQIDSQNYVFGGSESWTITRIFTYIKNFHLGNLVSLQYANTIDDYIGDDIEAENVLSLIETLSVKAGLIYRFTYEIVGSQPRLIINLADMQNVASDYDLNVNTSLADITYQIKEGLDTVNISYGTPIRLVDFPLILKPITNINTVITNYRNELKYTNQQIPFWKDVDGTAAQNYHSNEVPLVDTLDNIKMKKEFAEENYELFNRIIVTNIITIQYPTAINLNICDFDFYPEAFGFNNNSVIFVHNMFFEHVLHDKMSFSIENGIFKIRTESGYSVLPNHTNNTDWPGILKNPVLLYSDVVRFTGFLVNKNYRFTEFFKHPNYNFNNNNSITFDLGFHITRPEWLIDSVKRLFFNFIAGPRADASIETLDYNIVSGIFSNYLARSINGVPIKGFIKSVSFNKTDNNVWKAVINIDCDEVQRLMENKIMLRVLGLEKTQPVTFFDNMPKQLETDTWFDKEIVAFVSSVQHNTITCRPFYNSNFDIRVAKPPDLQTVEYMKQGGYTVLGVSRRKHNATNENQKILPDYSTDNKVFIKFEETLLQNNFSQVVFTDTNRSGRVWARE